MHSQPAARQLFLLSGALLAVMVFNLASPASAQSAATAHLNTPELASFPQISFTLTVHDPNGNFIPDLSSENVRVVEDDTAKPVDSLTYLEPGLELIVAVNSGAPLGYAARGGTRYQLLANALQAWSSPRPQNDTDRFSLITGAGILTAHESSNTAWADSLTSYTPNWERANPNLSALATALILATDPPPNPDMRSVILLITPLPSADSSASLNQSSNLAAQMGVPVFVWLVGPSAAINTTEGRALQSLATRTGGTLFLFSGTESIPDPELWFAPLRSLYRATYLSSINATGVHTLSAQVRRADLSLETSEHVFEVTVEPPEPIFSNLPQEVTRAWVSPEGETPFLAPSSAAIGFLVDFTDGHSRDLVSSRLLVDGVVVDENTNPPFTHFDWPLEAITVSAPHTLQVQVTDILGLEGTSQEETVQTIILAPEQTALEGIINTLSSWPVLVFFSILLAGIALAAVLILSGRKGGLRLPSRRKSREEMDPLTQPVPIPQEVSRSPRPASVDRITLPRQIQDSPARLVRLNASDLSPQTAPPIYLSLPEVSFGSDPRLASCVLESASISPVHARIIRDETGKFTLSDAGSQSGTWLNYAPVSKRGAHLEHGDLLHIGKMPFRFELLHRD